MKNLTMMKKLQTILIGLISVLSVLIGKIVNLNLVASPRRKARFNASTPILAALLVVMGLMGMSEVSWGQATQTFTSSGTFTVPAGVTQITVECWGGGGSGGGTGANTAKGGGGGAGGSYASSVLTSLTPGTIYTVTVGGTKAGTEGVGGKGNPSSFSLSGTNLVLAEGGNGGAAPNGANVAGGQGSTGISIGTTKRAGGNGAGGTASLGGGGGGAAGSSVVGGNASGTIAGSGNSGISGNLGTGATGSTAGSNGAAGSIYGGGGAGAFVNSNTNRSGGSGAAGYVLITWTVPAILTVENPTTSVTAASTCTPSTNIQIHRFKITGSGGGGTLTNFSFTTTGTYTASDITNFKIWHNTSDDFATASLLATQGSPSGPGSQTFPAFSSSIGNGTKCFWITMDVPSGAVNGRTIAVSASASSNMTTTASKAGASSASGTQTLLAPFVPTITPSSASICPGQSVTLSTTYPTPTSTVSFSQTSTVTINTSGAASPYPSTLAVSGIPTSGMTVKRVFINGFSHTFPSDADLLLQSPSGTNVIIMADAGDGTDASGLNYVFQDGAGAMVTTGLNASGTYQCTSGDGTADNFTSPGPGSINQSNPLLSSFAGDMNGTWDLFIIDDATGDGGSITSWSIEFEGPLPATMSWSPATGLNTTSGNTVVASPLSTTTYTVSPPAGVCATTATATVTVSGSAPSDPSNITATTPSLINIGGTVGFSADGNGATLRWYDAATGGTLLGTGSAYTTPVQCTPGNDTIYVETFNSSCSSSRFPASFTVRSLITSNPENGLICSAGGSVDLTANVTNGSSFSWTPSTGLSSTNSLLTTASPATTTQY
ncbi:MAG: hypothetical protein ACK5DJ_07655, partial [Bacteroidota bacterium]